MMNNFGANSLVAIAGTAIEAVTKPLNSEKLEVYKIVNGTAYHADTDERIIDILERARITKRRVRIFYGDIETGRDWMEEYDTIGYISRSTGRLQIPLLIKNSRSHGGGHLLDNHIVKITIEKEVLYAHPDYHMKALEVKETNDIEYKYTVSDIANFKKELQALNYIKFMLGERNRI